MGYHLLRGQILNPLAAAEKPFTPANIFGLALWLKADAIAGLLDGANVTSWADQSGNGRNATQGTATRYPLYKVNILNGKPVVRFDASNDFLTIAAFDLSATNAVTLFAVYTAAAGADRMVFEFSTNSNNVNDAFCLDRANTGTKPSASLKGAVGYSSYESKIINTTNYALASAIYNKSLSTAEVSLYINRFLIGSRATDSNNTEAFGNRAAYIGERGEGAGSLPLSGDIAEIVLYNSALSTANRQKVENYLMTKWGLGASTISIPFDGDSLTNGAGNNPTYPQAVINALAGDGNTWIWDNMGVDGQELTGMITTAPARIDPFYKADHAHNICVIWGGTNDLCFGDTNPTAVHASLQTYCLARRAVGFKVVVLTMLPRSDTNWHGQPTDRAEYNTLIRNNYTSYADALVDVAANTSIGDDGDELDTTYYKVDKVHLNTAGDAIVAGLVAPAITALIA